MSRLRPQWTAEQRHARHVAMIDTVAARLPRAEREQFIALHAEADELLKQGWSARKAAWALARPYKPASRKASEAQL